jgi:hypothetical protein
VPKVIHARLAGSTLRRRGTSAILYRFCLTSASAAN